MAWIETVHGQDQVVGFIRSPPVRWRGLKLGLSAHEDGRVLKSPPVRWRGLKLIIHCYKRIIEIVATRAVAWIETKEELKQGKGKYCRHPCGGVD